MATESFTKSGTLGKTATKRLIKVLKSSKKEVKKKYKKGYSYASSYHSDFANLPKEIKRHIKDSGIESLETKMFDVDVYYDIDIRNFWEKE